MLLKELIGKKLLILVGGPNMISLVQRAKQLGVYTIVTDYYSVEDSPSKLIADEYWNISWSDLDQLEAKCREEKIDGITTGYSESPVECCIELCSRLGLPCYCTKQQLAITRDKKLFKNECRKNGVPVIKEFRNIDDVDSFPVIVKPVDRAGSIGVGIANNRKELLEKYQYAYDKSYNHDVIIEEYISNGTKFDATYVVLNGEPKLISDCDTINGKKNGTEKVVQSAWLFPSKYHDCYVEKIDQLLKKMIIGLGIIDGYIFFSGFAINSNNDISFKFFESGFRLSGEHVHSYLSRCSIIEVLDLFIVHALTGSSNGVSYNKSKCDYKCVMINYYAKQGTISCISGVKDIESLEDCIFLIHPAIIGQKCYEHSAILTKLCMVHFCNTSQHILAEDVRKANELYHVFNETNEDMVYDRVDCNLIANWW